MSPSLSALYRPIKAQFMQTEADTKQKKKEKKSHKCNVRKQQADKAS